MQITFNKVAALVICCLGFIIYSSAQDSINVMTYNIRNSNAADGPNKWKFRKEKVVTLIKNVNPDVLGTQEVLFDQYKDLQHMLTDYSVFGVGRNNGKHAGEHSCIFYKTEKYNLLKGGNFWLSETPSKPGSKSWDAAITRICTWVQLEDKEHKTSFFLFNTHFDHRGVDARKNSARLLKHYIDSLCTNSAVIVTGDFNFEPGSEGYNVITEAPQIIPLKDAYTVNEPNYTDCGFDVTNTQCHRIDFIFYSSHYKQKGYKLHRDNDGKYYPSDHLTISAELLLKN
ncbi:MAG: endonuclease/exonuclease/phosphatase family protein [Chitinophagales bacterium]